MNYNTYRHLWNWTYEAYHRRSKHRTAKVARFKARHKAR